ncbi:MAG TPA: Holliday junction resolvase Hjc [Candidatus Nanoarchaeia archaeon]|nr:Holliday junction resolvase Hjc [Candidatus Nanoarchaeia archaeon]
MSRKSKGLNAERDLVHKFWKNGWAAVRVAGSGSMKYPSSDIIATNKIRRLAIECKTSAELHKYLAKEDINQLKEFSSLFQAEPWFAVRFDRHNWLFMSIEDIKCSGTNYCISLETAEKKGLLFEEVIK